MQRVVIVGGGLAGHRAADALRREQFGGELVLVGEEPHRPYDRPPLSKQLLAGTFEVGECDYAPLEGLTWTLEEPAVGLDLARGVVVTARQEVGFDGLIIATGRRAREWPALPAMTGFHTLRTVDDALALRAAIDPATPVVIVGAGFIGCEVAGTLRNLGVEHVAVVDVAPYPMPVLGPEIGARAIALHERHGVQLHLSARVAGFEGGEHVEAVVLEDGTRVPAGLVLIAVGSVPNSEWLEGSGLELVDGAVRCDVHCFAAENVVAAGDVAAWPHRHAEDVVCVEHWAIARDMGARAAANLVGERVPFAPVPTFWSDQHDVKIKSAGLLSAADRFEILEEDAERPSLVAEARRGDELVGAVVFNKNKSIIGYQRQLAAALQEEAPYARRG
jgi:3-phenylpropionate/trans-cinnamate dioxygenase ferredoxin reductase component